MLTATNEMRRKPNRSQPSFIGGYVSPEQKAKAQALATIYGTSVQGLIRELIDRAANQVITPSSTETDACA